MTGVDRDRLRHAVGTITDVELEQMAVALLDELEAAEARIAALIEGAKHYPGDDPEFCWYCEKPFPCAAQLAEEAVTSALAVAPVVTP